MVFSPRAGRTARCQPTHTGRDRALSRAAAGSELHRAACAAFRGQPSALGAAGPPRSAAPSPLAAWQPGTSPSSAATTRPPAFRTPSPVSRSPHPALLIPRPVPHPALRGSAAPPSGRSVPREAAAFPPRGRGSLRPHRHVGGSCFCRSLAVLRCWVCAQVFVLC